MHCPGVGLYEIHLDHDAVQSAVDGLYECHRQRGDDVFREDVEKALKEWLDDCVERLTEYAEQYLFADDSWRHDAHIYHRELEALNCTRENERRKALAEARK